MKIKILLIVFFSIWLSQLGFAQVYILNEDFSLTSGIVPPIGWINQSSNNINNESWHFDNPTNRNINFPITAPFAIVDFNQSSSSSILRESILESKYFDASFNNNVILKFKHVFTSNSNIGYVDLFDGNQWLNVTSFSSSTVNPESFVLNVSNIIGGVTNAKIRFRFLGNGSGFWALDNLSIYSPVNLDLAITLSSPAFPYQSGNVPLNIKLSNLGIDTIFNATLSSSINNLSNSNINFNGIIPPAYDTILQLGNININSSSINTLKVFSSNPNGLGDQNKLNDTIDIAFRTNLCGVYTVGGLNPDFPTMTSAVNFLVQYGVSCPTVFQIRPGVYNEYFQLGPIQGANSVNTVTFISESGDSSSVIISRSSPGLTVSLVDSKYVRFKKVTLGGVMISNRAGDLELSNNKLSYLEINGFESKLQILNNLVTESISAYGLPCQSLLVKGNRFVGTNSLVFDRNTFTNDVLIEDNEFICSNPNNGYGVHFSLPSGRFKIRRNIFKGFGTGIMTFCEGAKIEISSNRIINNNIGSNNEVFGINLIVSRDSINIFNNYISLSGQGKAVGFYSYGSGNILMESNNVNINSSNGSSRIVELNNNFKRTIKNNIFYNENSGYIYYINDSVILSNTYSSNNNHYSNDKKKYYIGGNILYSLDEWKSYSGKDITTKSVCPFYKSNTKLEPSQSLLIGAGLFNSNINYDIDSTIRLIPPSLGAKEITLCNNDIGVNEILPVFNNNNPGFSPIEVVMYNHGTSTINQANLSYTINQGVVNTYNWSGSITSGQSVTVQVGTFNFQTGIEYTIKAWSELTQVQDCNHYNDTIIYKNAIQMCGVYTVGGLNPDFPTITSAVNFLVQYGVSCPTVFQIRPGVYNEYFQLGPIQGANSVNTVTFISESGDSSSVIISRSSPGLTVSLVDSKYVRFKKVTLGGVMISNRAGDLELSNNKLSYLEINGFESKLQILNNLVTESISAYGLPCQSLLVKGNRFVGTNSLVFDRNTFTNDVLIEDNEFICSNPNNGYGVHFSLPSGRFKIRRNIFKGFGTGIMTFCEGAKIEISSNRIINNNIGSNNEVFGINLIVSRDSINIFNNYISLSGQGKAVGFYSYGSGNILMESNNVNINSSNGSSRIVELNNNFKRTIKNNIFYNENSGYIYYINDSVILSNTYSSNNNHYSNDKKKYYIGGNILYSLDEWKSYSGKDITTKSVCPFYKSNTKLEPSQSLLIGAGLFNSNINYDIDSTIRLIPPSLGAKEITLCNNDIGVNEILPVFNNNSPGVSPIVVKLFNHGQSIINQASLNYTINQGVLNSYNWSGSIAPGQSVNVQVGTYNFQTGLEYTIQAWSELTQVSDCNHYNDTIDFKTAIPMCGVFTVGGVNPDFSDLQKAFDRLMKYGVSCRVKLNVRSGIYLNNLYLSAIPGASSVNNIEIVSENNDSTFVYIGGLITLADAKYLNIKSINLTTLLITGQSGDIKIANCKIQNQLYVFSSSGIINICNNYFNEGIVLSGINYGINVFSNLFDAANSQNCAIANVDRFNAFNGLRIFKNKTINGLNKTCQFGIRLVLVSGLVEITNNEIANCIYGIYDENTNGANYVISQNKITVLNCNSDFYGIYIGNNQGDYLFGSII